MDTQQIIKDRLEILPEDIKQAIKSTDLAGKFDLIANKHGLHVDQNGLLQTETILVMLGLEPTADYVDNIKRELDISRNEAESIADDVNKEIFYSIRESLQEMQSTDEELAETEVAQSVPIPTPSSTIPPTFPQTPPKPSINYSSLLEKAGQFTIEKPPVGMGSPSQYKENKLNREAILKDIEDIENLKKPKTSILDHFLEKPMQSTEKIEVKTETKTEVRKAVDPYREQV